MCQVTYKNTYVDYTYNKVQNLPDLLKGLVCPVRRNPTKGGF